MEKDLINTEYLRNQDPEKYFQEVLEVSEFEGLKKLVEDSDRVISWIKLIKLAEIEIKDKKIAWIVWTKKLDLRGTSLESLRKIKKIEWNLDCECVNTLKDLWDLEEVDGSIDIRGTAIKALWKLKKVSNKLSCGGLSTLESLWDLEEVWWGLYIKETKIKTLGKLKRIWLNLYCGGLSTLESLGELEEIGGNLEIKGTKIKSLGELKVVKWNINCENLKILEDIGTLEKIWLDLNIIGLSLELQMAVMEKIEKWTLKVEWEFYLGGNIRGIEVLIEQKIIPWTLYIIWLSVKQQMQIIDKVVKRELKVEDLITQDGLDEMYENLYQDNKLDFENFKTIIWNELENVKKIEIRELWEWILLEEYKRIRTDVKKKWEKIIEENKGKNLTKDEKKDIRESLKELDVELQEMKDRIENFGVEIVSN